MRLWNRIRTSLRIALDGLWRKGYLVGNSAEEAFYVQCDEETNMSVTGASSRAEIWLLSMR